MVAISVRSPKQSERVAVFGVPASVDPHRLFKLPRPMQREGVLLLQEMGQAVDEIARQLGLSVGQVGSLIDDAALPFRRMGETDD